MESLWFIEYDNISMETDFLKINFTSLLENAVSDPDALNLSQLYNFSNNKFENILQKYLSEFLEVLKNFFQDLLEISENENITAFSKSVLLYIQVERLYFLTYWRIFSIENFVSNRLLASYLRIKNLLTSFHLNCFPKLYRSKELNDAVSGPKHRKRFSLTRSDQGTYDLLLKRSEELKFFQVYLCNTFEAIIKECKKQKPHVENISIVFKKTLHYAKNIINKNSYYLKQENDNLFGNVAEKVLMDKINGENKSKMELVRKEIEKERNFEDRWKRNKNTTIVKFDEGVQIFSNNVNPNYQSKEIDCENKVIKEIIQETEKINRKVSIKLLEHEQPPKKVTYKCDKKTQKECEEEKKEEKKSIKFLKSKGFIPPPPPPPPPPVKGTKFVEDPQIKESIMKSLTFYFKREEKDKFLSLAETEKLESKTRDTLKKIKSNITDVIDERKINKYKTMNEQVNSNLESLINDLTIKKKKIMETYQTIILEDSEFFRESKSLSVFIPNKHQSIEMVSGNRFDSFPDTPPKLTDSFNDSIDEKLILSKSQIKRAELNVISENEEEVKEQEHKISDATSVLTSNVRNTHALTTLTSPLLRNSNGSANNTNSFPLSAIWNFFRKSIRPSEQRNIHLKSKLSSQQTLNVNKSNKLNISAKDIIKIDSNTEINEELKFVKTSEKMDSDMIRDEDLFKKAYFDENEGNDSDSDLDDEQSKEKLIDTQFLTYLKKTRDEEILKKNSVFFLPEQMSLKSFFGSNSQEMGGTKSMVFNAMVKNRQIQNEIQKILTKPLNDGNFVERNDCYSYKMKYEPYIFFNVFERKKK